MANNKDSFILYCDILHTIEQMPSDKAGDLFKHILRYVNDLNPVSEDLIVNLTFEPIKQTLKRDLKKWEGYIEKQRVNGAKGGRPKETQITQAFLQEPKKADSVSVPVSVPVSVSENNLINQFFLDFPNSSHLETISITLKIPKETLINKLPEFRKSANLSYPSMIKFAEHFKNWVKKQPTHQIIKRKAL